MFVIGIQNIMCCMGVSVNDVVGDWWYVTFVVAGSLRHEWFFYSSGLFCVIMAQIVRLDRKVQKLEGGLRK